MSSILGIIQDKRLIGYIFQFAPFSSLPLVSKKFQENVNLVVSPILVKRCLEFVEANKGTLSTLFDKLSTISLSTRAIESLNILCRCIRDFAKANGNTIQSEGIFDPLSLAREIQEEDESLIVFYKTLRKTRHIPADEPLLETAYKIRDYMLSHRSAFGRIRRLSLSDCRLEKIPKEITYFQNLIILDLSRNKIKKIPQEIQAFSKLLQLDLSKNQISSWWDKPLFPNTLTTISLHNNQMTHFPQMLLSLPRLTDLNLAFNCIETLPADKTDFPQLRALDISYNRICKIPKALTCRKNLVIDTL